MNDQARKRWRHVDAIFSEAMELTPDERAAFLDDACQGDEALRHEVEELLSFHDEEDDLFSDPTELIEVSLLPGLNDLPSISFNVTTGELIGAYRILKQIGYGGMGAVYLAERADGQFRQRVALKLLRHGVVTPDSISRFRLERQILANLKHPNIARLLDGGVINSLPYFVLEYIHGAPIDQYCDIRQLTIRQRLRLFLTVCEAVQHAHQNFVVHRDLKPSNILVRDDGEVKLLDFGIAKVIDEALAKTMTVPNTMSGRFMLTPEYAPPEQVRGETVTAASDVYALGVVLYELLTGDRPYIIGRKTPAEIERVICEVEPKKPSTAVLEAAQAPTQGDDDTHTKTLEARATTADKLRRQLSGDLDTILLKALQKEPERRYQSVQQFADDLQRYLGGHPVTARKDTFVYRARKFVRRHRLGVASATAFVFMILVFAVAMTLQQAETAEERDRADETLAFIMDTFERIKPTVAQGRAITAEGLVKSGLLGLGDLQEQPLTQARAMHTMAEVAYVLALYPMADSLFHHTIETRQALLEAPHEDLAESLYNRGLVLMQQRAFDDANQHLEQALTMRRALFDEQSPEVLESLNGLAWWSYRTGRYDEAVARFRQVLKRKNHPPLHEHPEIAEALDGLGTVFFEQAWDAPTDSLRQGLFEDADSVLREALFLRKKVLGAMHPQTASTLYSLANTLHEKGDLDSAEVYHREALWIYQNTLFTANDRTARSQLGLAMLLRDKGDFDEADSLYLQAYETYLAVLGPKIPTTAFPLISRGRLLVRRGLYNEAVEAFRAGLEIYRHSWSDDHVGVAAAKTWLGNSLWRIGNYAEGEQLLLDGYQVLKELPSERRLTRETLAHLIDLYEAWGKPNQAAQYRAEQEASSSE